VSTLSRLLHRDGGDDPQSLVIEPMRRRHLRDVMAIEHQVYPRPWSINVFRGELDWVRHGERYYVVARRPGRLHGYAGAMFTLDEAHVTNIAVDPAVQRGGVGTRLLADLSWEARRRACCTMTLEVRHTNVAAQEMYRGFGFVPAGVRQRYYENTDDAIIMWCHDIDHPEFAERLDRLDPLARRDRS
jgi:ribosomal-protein-alanine N-acetyltransferase